MAFGSKNSTPSFVLTYHGAETTGPVDNSGSISV